MPTIKELIESKKETGNIITSLTEDTIDVQYFIRNAQEFLNDLGYDDKDWFPEDMYKAAEWAVSRINQTNPDGDITKRDLYQTLDHFSAPNVDRDTGEEAIDLLWDAIS